MKRIIYALIFTLTVCLAVDAAAPKILEARRVDFEEIRKSVQDTVGGTHY